MGETYLHVTSPEVYSKRFSEYVKQFHADDTDDVKKEDKKHRLQNKNGNRDGRGRRHHPRRMSESSMLPPINSKPESSLPTFSNGIWTFGSNTKDSTTHMKGVGIRRVLPQTESQKSRHDNGKIPKTMTMASIQELRKSPDSVRLSPIASIDKKLKPEKRHPTKSIDNTQKLVAKLSPQDQRYKVKGHRNSKNKPQESEPFSIRRKIEQFKRYHEEQYLLKLQKLKQDSEIKIELSKRKPSPIKEAPRLKLGEIVTSRIDNEAVTSADEADSGNESSFNLSAIIKSSASRQKSAKTWRTWRDVNDSYAYTDVEKYIEDNELMTPEKAVWIKDWTLDVDKEFFQKKKDKKSPGSDIVL